MEPVVGQPVIRSSTNASNQHSPRTVIRDIRRNEAENVSAGEPVTDIQANPVTPTGVINQQVQVSNVHTEETSYVHTADTTTTSTVEVGEPVVTSIAYGAGGAAAAHSGKTLLSQQVINPTPYNASASVTGAPPAYTTTTTTSQNSPDLIAVDAQSRGTNKQEQVFYSPRNNSVISRKTSIGDDQKATLDATRTTTLTDKGTITSVLVQGAPQVVREEITEGEPFVIKETVQETGKTTTVQKTIIVEEQIERVYVVSEEYDGDSSYSDEEIQIRERLVEVEQEVHKKVYRNNQEVQVIEQTIEVPQRRIIEKLVQDEIVESSTATPRRQGLSVSGVSEEVEECIIEVPECEVIHIAQEKIVDVPVFKEKVVIREVPVPQRVIKEVPEYIDQHIDKEFRRLVPLPVEQVCRYEFTLPLIRPYYEHVEVPLYIPRFVEVPFPSDLMPEAVARHAEHFASHLSKIIEGGSVSLCEVENIAGAISATDFHKILTKKDVGEAIYESWTHGRLKVDQESWNRVNEVANQQPASACEK